jgi:hypothetical protein
VYLKSRTSTLTWRHFQHRHYVPLLESLLTTICDGPVNSLECLPDIGGGNNDISKLLDLGAMAKLTCSVQMSTCIAYGDAIARKMGWITIISIVESKDTNQKKTWANRKSDKVITSITPLFNPDGTVYLKSRTATLKWRHFQHRNYVPLLESLLKTILDGTVSSLECLPDVGGGNNYISKLLDLGAMAKMTCSVQMAAGITYGDAIARKMGWFQITSIVESKDTNQKKTWANRKSDKVITSI